ncbi:MAG: right-handed parallel beta-helix repeat-containing protein [Phycisphaerales bacterium]
MKKAFVLGGFLSALACSLSSAAVLRVPSEYSSIQQAISDSSDGDTVLVSPGIYYETINFGGKNITVTSTDPNDRGIVGYTIINADGDGTVVTFENNETNDAVLSGFTITGGVGTLDYSYEEIGYSYKQFSGAGIYCSYNASPTISHCVITRNHGPYSQSDDGMNYEFVYSTGGGIYCDGGGAVLTHNTIYNNSAYEGGGICAWSSTTVSNNVIYNNSAAYGGGVYGGYCYLVNNTIVNNDVSKNPENGVGGNVYVYFDEDSSTGAVANNLICGAASGGGLYHYRAHDDLIRFNNVWNNSPANYGMEDPTTYEDIWDDTADWTGSYGNISADPKFLNAAMNDFHVKAESPCVSAGDPNSVPGQTSTDMDGDPRIFALRVDIGADEHVGYVKPLANAGADLHVLAPEPITLDGTGSYFSDPDGANTYQWVQTQGAAVELSDATAGQPVFTPPAEGWYVFELVVGDGQYTSGPDRVLVVVGNTAPVADAGPDRLDPLSYYIVLDGSGSYDADPPDELTYTWTQMEGPTTELLQISAEEAEYYGIEASAAYFLCNQAGTYVFELVVSDGFSISEPDTVKIEVTPFTSDANNLVLAAMEQDYIQYPAISGAKLVYCAGDYRDSSWSIQCMDIESGWIDTLQSQATDTMPQIDGDLIVWTTGPEGYYQPIRTSVVIADAETRVVHPLRLSTNTDSYGYPAISGKKAVWLRHRNVNTNDTSQYEQSSYDICGADVTNPAKPVYFTIAEQVGHGLPYPYDNYRQTYETPLDICGDLVVWEADGDIYGADISDLTQIRVFPISTASKTQKDPSISGRRVVWTDQRNDRGDIYGADLSDLDNIREFEVYVGSGVQTQPDIDGQMIAFVGGNSTGSIYLYCLTREYGPVASPESRRYYGGGPRLDGSTLIWHDYYYVEGITFKFGYGRATGPVQNVTTGVRYDYIQHAIDSAEAGDTIMVEPGVYHEKIRLQGKNLTLTSTDPEDPAVRAATIIAGPGQCVTIADDETADCVFTGFTVTGGSLGVYCGGSTPTIENCVITGNTSAGVKVWNEGNPTFSRCEIAGNGTGIEMWAHRENRMILKNYGTFRNCLIVANRRTGVYSGYPTLENCTIADNLGLGVDAVLARITNSILYFNNEGAGGMNLDVESAKSTVTYSDVQGGWAGDGNIDADPLFVARGAWPTTGDYHLQSEGWFWDVLGGTWAWADATSLCIDAGDPATPVGDEAPCDPGDALSERAGVNTRINLGAYGGTSEASLAP